MTKLQHGLSMDELSLNVALIIEAHMLICELTGQPLDLMNTVHTCGKIRDELV